MADIDIDGKRYSVQDGISLLAACQTLVVELPYFCWHPALGSVGACRQCAVLQYKDAGDSRGRLVMACMTPVVDGLRIGIAAEEARHFRSENIELLMTNHPHDCPVCEEGGECHLQDMTLLSGHTFRRYRGLKRTHSNQDLGPFINHEMNRCIACYRCVRFYYDYAGGKDLQALGMHNNVYFGRHEDGTLENEFSGNLVEVCPTGVFTDKTFSAHYARKWDLQSAPSLCVHCGIGCNTAPGERYGTLRRIVNRYHSAVNGYFLCDRGRFGYGFVNSEKRIRKPLRNAAMELSAAAAQQYFRELLQASDKPLLGIGSPRASLEANFALRALVGADNFFLGLEDTEYTLLQAIADIIGHGGIAIASLHEAEQADAVLILGEDPTHSAPRLALAVRQAVRNAAFDVARSLHIEPWQDAAVRALQRHARSPMCIAALCATRLDDVATHLYRGSPDDIARFGFAVAHGLDPQAPPVAGLSEADKALAATVAAELRQARRPLVVSGTASGSLAVIEAAYNVAKALPAAGKQLLFTVPECNSLGLALLGGKRLTQAFAHIGNTDGCTAIVLENDLYRRAPAAAVDAFLRKTEHLIVIDSLENPTAQQAELLLPAAPFAEAEGTLLNYESRAQRYFPVYPAPQPVRGSWQWLADADENGRWRHHDALTRACAEQAAVFAALAGAAPDADYRIDGGKIPRQPHRYSGRTAMHADLAVAEPGQPQDSETPFAFSMEGATAKVPPALLPVVRVSGWNSNQAVNQLQQGTNGPLRGGDPGVKLLAASGTLPWFTHIPPAFERTPDRWLVVPLPHIFGSEELSLYAEPIAARAPQPSVLLHPQDAAKLAAEHGDWLEIAGADGERLLRLPLCLDDTLPQGLLGVTSGFFYIDYRQTATITTLSDMARDKSG
ncbi:MAG: NADH-quinone oxidoreductase subunit NuoG [Gammaproteobacteria bacterium]